MESLEEVSILIEEIGQMMDQCLRSIFDLKKIMDDPNGKGMIFSQEILAQIKFEHDTIVTLHSLGKEAMDVKTNLLLEMT